MPNYLHIVVATDSNYLIHTATLINSIARSHNSQIVMHVFGSNLSDTDKEFLDRISSKIVVRFYEVDSKVIEKRLFNSQSISANRSITCYSRLLIPEMLPEDIDRCIYMDVDAIVLGSLEPLMTVDLTDAAIAGVQDTVSSRHLKILGLRASQTYINSGFILWNLDYCRKNKVVDKFADFVKSFGGNVPANDQGTINGVLSDEIKLLDPRYNVMTPFFDMSATDIKNLFDGNRYSQEEYNEAVDNPVFVHFTPFMTTRPWMENCRHPLKDQYWNFRLEINPDRSLLKDRRIPRLKYLSWCFYNCRPLFNISMKLIDKVKG